MAEDALQNPFNPAQPVTGSPSAPATLSPPSKPALSHRPSFTTVLSTADLSAAVEGQVVLPSAPPLSHDALAGDDFDASEFLLARRHTPLDDLRSELRGYLSTLRTSLVGVINEEYEAFIGLSLGLKHAAVSQSLATIPRPVLSIRGEVMRVKDELEDMRSEMSSVLDERKEVREMKAMMRRLLATEEAVDKVEGLLKPAGDADKSRSLDLAINSPAKRLERIASEYTHMLYLVERAGDLPYVQALQPRIDRVTTALRFDLSSLLSAILAGSPAAPTYREELTTALRTFLSLGLISQVEEVMRRDVVRPFVKHAVHRDALSSPADSPALASHPAHVPPPYRIEPIAVPPAHREGTDAAPLAALYNRILAFISHDCGVLLDVGERVLAIPHERRRIDAAGAASEANETEKVEGFEILTNVLFDEIGTALMGELGGVIYAAGRPTVFHQNYLLTTAFVSCIESLSPTLARLTSLRSHSTYTTLLKRFQLPVYFQLRFKDAVTSVERAFEVGQASGGGGAGGFVMSESEAAFKALRRCWDEDVWLEELAGRFWRLTLQIVSRYRTWLNDRVPRYVLPTSASSANLAAAAPGSPASRASFDGDRSRLAVSAGNSRPATPGPVSGNDEVSEETTLRQLTMLIADAQTMERRVFNLFEERIRGRLPPDVRDDAGDVMRESLSSVTAVVPSLSSQITTILIKRCAEHLKLVRSVASQVRASTRKGPSEPSYFVHNILKEVRAYLGGPGRVVEEELRRRLATVVVEDIAGRYTSILSTQKKTEDSLRWLKKGRQGLSFFGRAAASASPAEDGGSDDDRVKMQMMLDVETLAKDAEELGVDIEGSEAVRTLRKAAAGEVKDEEVKK
ncbi:hypothetical protein JCM10295v2_002290 [Rhodotorula toruloides]